MKIPKQVSPFTIAKRKRCHYINEWSLKRCKDAARYRCHVKISLVNCSEYTLMPALMAVNPWEQNAFLIICVCVRFSARSVTAGLTGLQWKCGHCRFSSLPGQIYNQYGVGSQLAFSSYPLMSMADPRQMPPGTGVWQGMGEGSNEREQERKRVRDMWRVERKKKERERERNPSDEISDS